MTLTPAYGRDYKSKKAVLEDWNKNKDFIIADLFHSPGRYINKQDFENSDEKSVTIRYNKTYNICVIHK